MRRSLAISIALTAATLGLAITTANAAPIYLYGNLGSVNTTTTSNSVGYLNAPQPNQYQAQGFTLGTSAWDITSVQFGLGAAMLNQPVVQLFSDVSGAPGSVLATFTGPSEGAVSSKALYTFTGNYSATASTSYWFVLSNGFAISESTYEWFTDDTFSSPSAKNDSGILYLGTSQRNDTGSWNGTLSSLSIKVSGVQAVPEPSTVAMAAMAGLAGVAAACRRRRAEAE